MPAARSTRLALLASFAVGSLALAGCSSNPSGTATTHPAGVPYFSRAGTGNETMPQIALPAAWTLLWHFDCTDPNSARSFVLTSTRSGGSATRITDQDGLEGSGYHPFHTAGDYTFTVTTTCTWRVVADTAGTETIPSTTTPAG